MTTITFDGGRVVMHGDKVGTEKECCCGGCTPCPDMESLCISITLTDYNGTVYTADQDDIFWFGDTGTVYFNGFDYAVTIACNIPVLGGISVTAGWASMINDCLCTSASGNDSISCSSGPGWHIGTASGVIEFDDVGFPCDGGCPANLGSFSVTFADPPC